MNKNILTIVATSAVTAVLTTFTYQWIAQTNPHTMVVREQVDYKTGVNMNPRHRAILTSMNDGGSGDMFNFRMAAEIATPSVVHITSKGRSNNRYGFDFGGTEISSGSGVIWSADGYIITNNHVIENASELEVDLSDNRSFSARIVGRDPSTDLALIKITDLEGLTLTPIEFGNSDDIKVGDWVLAVGNPFNLASTVTAGIVSAKGRNIDILEGEYSIESFIQSDASVNPGNSGGAMIDPAGRLVGINTAIMTRSGGFEGFSFAVPSNLVKKVVMDLKEFGEVQRGFLGVFIQNITSEIAKQENLTSLEGVYLERVKPGEAADEAGLRDGDVVTHVNGIKIKTHPELQETVAQFRPGEKLDIEYIRGGKSYQTTVILRNKNNTTALGKPRVNEPYATGNADEALTKLGMDLRNLTDAEMRRLKDKGVMVSNVRSGSKISETHMEPGFIITKVNNEPVASVSDVVRMLKRSGNEVTLEGYYEEYIDQGFFNYVFQK